MLSHKKMESLLLFIAVAEHLSFTKAAAELGVSKAYLSEQVRRLELEFNCPLLIRSTRSVRLTEQGRKALSQGLEIRASLLSLERNLGDQQDTISGPIRITAPRMFCQHYLMPLCCEFRTQYPLISFSIDSSETSYNLNQNELDLAFRATINPPETLIATRLFDYDHCFVASPEYLERCGVPKSAADLKQHQCISNLQQSSWPMLSGHVEFKPWMMVNDNAQLKMLTLDGQGVLRIARYFVGNELQQGRLQEVLNHEVLPGPSVYMLQPQLIYPSAKIKVFTGFVKEFFASKIEENRILN
ncbi:LysR family transcriptional regulator [Alginatibacterium sediminis]|uniref:LysR family transcriptional regulator n=1 Tax=Alginatibacterium sediminis TaxID=2164068 RepID=A0A420EHV8_9ALTE|nr:LysR family transcriptional regulator [Alginatibacterium sediminis]RKF20302.1 LysR family transcriptional regulator [Alginatibacterium sediminis]